MSYTPNVPQANQQIASTQSPIQSNFTVIQTNMQQDHSWNGNAINSQTDGTHQQVQLPNISDPSALGTGINGVYYCNSGNPKFYNGAVNYLNFSPVQYFQKAGLIALNSSGFTTILTIPGNSCGNYIIFLPNSSLHAYAIGQFITTASSGTFFNETDPNLTPQFSGLNFQAKLTNPADNGNYKYVFFYA